MMYTHAAAGIAGAVLAGLLSWNVQAWRYDAQIAEIKAQHSRALADAHQKALDDTIKLQRIKDAAIEKAEQRAKQNADAAAAARRTADGLRRDLASVPARIAAATDSAAREYAAAASVVLDQCTAEVADLARVADGHAADVRLMLQAWPK